MFETHVDDMRNREMAMSIFRDLVRLTEKSREAQDRLRMEFVPQYMEVLNERVVYTKQNLADLVRDAVRYCEARGIFYDNPMATMMSDLNWAFFEII